MSGKHFITVLALLFMTAGSYAQSFVFKGTVLSKKTNEPVEYATVVLESTEQWAVADVKGQFSIPSVQKGKNIVSVSCIGYATDTREIVIDRNIENYKIYLAEDNLTLEGVVVTAKEKDNSATTSRMIDKAALDHIQMMNVSDISSLLPGGQTVNPSLLGEQRFNIRAGSGESGNASFGTAVEVDGVRLSSNASFSSAQGVATNNIASTNVESIEVITGVPSVEYGDMSSGIVKVNTRKGKTPVIITMSTNPSSKQVSASKGFALGRSRTGASNGVINANIEYTKDISTKMSPYTAYDRKQIQLTYSNTFDKGLFSKTPLQFSIGATGNLGGYNSKGDPDAFVDTFKKQKDDTYRGNFSFNWLLSKSWITNLELNGSIVYSDRNYKEKVNFSSSGALAKIHGREEGYFVAEPYDATKDEQAVILVPRTPSDYYTMCVDDRPINWKLTLKANWARQWGGINNKVKIGADWTGDGNFGIGQYSKDMSKADSFREYRYNEIPFMNNVSAYIEDNIMIPIGSTRLNLIAGLRNDNTIIKGSAYGITSSLSPRFNAKYTVFSEKERYDKVFKGLSFRASWGVASKLPSFSILFPEPKYKDYLTFTPPSDSEASTYMAYYISPRTVIYNPDLKWQRNHQSEIGVDMNIGGHNISLAAYYNKTLGAYRTHVDYYTFKYNYTSAEQFQAGCTIPEANRVYNVDRLTGEVTVSDKTGALAPQAIEYTTKEALDAKTYASNDKGSITRYGLEWTIDFKRIESINTTFRIDGSYYGYRFVDTNLAATSSLGKNGYDGKPFKYVGIYYGGDSYSNGSESQSVSTNLTVTTHIPKVRLILSLRLEAALMNYSRNLSERADGSKRSHVATDSDDKLAIVEGSVYDGNNYALLYPDFVVSTDDINKNPDIINQIIANPEKYSEYAFLQQFKNSKGTDAALYSDLSTFAKTTNYVWWFAKNHYSPYFSANISVTKEIGDIASLSFYANNFFNNLGQVKSSQTGNFETVDRFIPGFYYGLSLRLKF